MIGRSSFAPRLATILVVALGLFACGDNEPTQRKAFVEFLQSRIIAKPGVHVPKLTAEESEAFGPYAKHYAISADFNGHLDESVSRPLQKALAAAPRALDQLAGKRGEIADIKGGFAKIRAALDRELASADAAHAALQQPADLKPVYDQAYNRDVTQPARAMIEIFPDADEAMAAILALAEFLNQHSDKITVNGPMLQVADPSLQPHLQTLVDAVRAKQDAVQKAQQRLRNIAFGS